MKTETIIIAVVFWASIFGWLIWIASPTPNKRRNNKVLKFKINRKSDKAVNNAVYNPKEFRKPRN